MVKEMWQCYEQVNLGQGYMSAHCFCLPLFLGLKFFKKSWAKVHLCFHDPQ